MKKILLTIICTISCIAAFGQWSTNPMENNQITPEGKFWYDSEMAVTKSGITYFLGTTPEGHTASYIQVFDKEGKALYPLGGKKFSDYVTWTWTQVNRFLFTDNEENAIMGVSDCRNAGDGNDLSYSVYKMSPQGEMLWGENGIDLDKAQTYSLSAKLDMISLEDGSHIFAWTCNIQGGALQIRLQRVSSDGKILWDKPVTLSDDKIPYQYPYLINAGFNEFLLVYVKGSNQDLMVRKMDFEGESIWPEDVCVYQGGFGGVPPWTFIDVIPDGKGGVFIGWHDDRFYTNYESAFVNYVNSEGTINYVAGNGGQQLAYNADHGLRGFSPKLTYDSTNDCLYAIWRETSSGQSWQRLMAQKLNMTGELLWGAEGVEIVPLEERGVSYYSAQMGDPGQFAAFYQVYNTYQDQQVWATLIDGKEGDYVWKDKHLRVSLEESKKTGMESSILVDEKYWLTMWNDDRVLPETPINDEGKPAPAEKIYMQRVFKDGTFSPKGLSMDAVVASKSGLQVYPSIIKDQAEFVIDNTTAGQVNLSIYSLSGQKVAEIYNGKMGQGVQKLPWNASEVALPQGVYLGVAKTTEKAYSTKIIIK